MKRVWVHDYEYCHSLTEVIRVLIELRNLSGVLEGITKVENTYIVVFRRLL